MQEPHRHRLRGDWFYGEQPSFRPLRKFGRQRMNVSGCIAYEPAQRKAQKAAVPPDSDSPGAESEMGFNTGKERSLPRRKLAMDGRKRDRWSVRSQIPADSFFQLGGELGVLFLDRVGDGFREDQAEAEVLVLRSVHSSCPPRVIERRLIISMKGCYPADKPAAVRGATAGWPHPTDRGRACPPG